MFVDHFQKQNQFFLQCFSKWKKKINENNYTNEEINERFTQINKPYNSFCLSDYIDYNCVVDTIITRSQPYGEQNNNANIKEDKIIDLVKKTSLNPENLKKNSNIISNKISGTSNLFKNISSNQSVCNNMNQQNIHSDTLFRPIVQPGIIIPTINQNGNEINLPNYSNNVNNGTTLNDDASREPSNLLEALSSLQKSNDLSHSFNNDVLTLLYSNASLGGNIQNNLNNNIVINNNNNIINNNGGNSINVNSIYNIGKNINTNQIIPTIIDHPAVSKTNFSIKNPSFSKDQVNLLGYFPVGNQSFAYSQQKFFDQAVSGNLEQNNSSNLNLLMPTYSIGFGNNVKNIKKDK